MLSDKKKQGGNLHRLINQERTGCGIYVGKVPIDDVVKIIMISSHRQ